MVQQLCFLGQGCYKEAVLYTGPWIPGGTMWSPAGLPGMIWTGPGVQVECQESHWTPTGFQLEFFGSEKNLTKLDFAGNHSQWIPGGFLVIIPSGFLMDSD